MRNLHTKKVRFSWFQDAHLDPLLFPCLMDCSAYCLLSFCAHYVWFRLTSSFNTLLISPVMPLFGFSCELLEQF